MDLSDGLIKSLLVVVSDCYDYFYEYFYELFPFGPETLENVVITPK
jgi:hypothetical protein